MPTVIHHKAALDGSPLPPNSLAAIEACLDARAAWIEIDVLALASDDYLLAHDADLSHETSGSGPLASCSAAAARKLRIKGTPHRVPLLSDVVALFLQHALQHALQHPTPSRLQIDFKNITPFPDDEPLLRLRRIIDPIAERVVVSSVADWQLRRLRRLAPTLPLGLDIQAHLDLGMPEPARFPVRLGAYGYLDDHPLAHQRIWSAAQYLEDRFQSLVNLVPRVAAFYVRHTLLKHALDDGFDAAAFLHKHGMQLAAWTLDADNVEAERSLPALVAAGVDLFTSNTPRALARKISC
jgi:glycerophosphoryl diester phosphodiesterase